MTSHEIALAAADAPLLARQAERIKALEAENARLRKWAQAWKGAARNQKQIATLGWDNYWLVMGWKNAIPKHSQFLAKRQRYSQAENERHTLLLIALAAWELSSEVVACGDRLNPEIIVALDDLLVQAAKTDDWEAVRQHLRQELDVIRERLEAR